jgi:hypothetical protein
MRQNRPGRIKITRIFYRKLLERRGGRKKWKVFDTLKKKSWPNQITLFVSAEKPLRQLYVSPIKEN